jgi:hypothetical protein
VTGDPYQLIATGDDSSGTGSTVVLDHAYRAEGMAGLLRDLIIGRIVDQSAARFGLTLDEADLAAAEQQMDVYGDLPATQRDFVQHQIAMQAVIDTSAPTSGGPTTTSLCAEQLARSRVKHILVATEAEANDVLAQPRTAPTSVSLRRRPPTPPAGSKG